MTLRIPAWLQTLLQLLLACFVVYLYQIENDTFFRVFVLATAGFAIHANLPLAYRLPFFALLSMAGAFVVFGPSDAVWLLVSGWILIIAANLPVSVKARVAALVAIAAILALGRAGVIDTPWSSSVWPILGSMFAFRLVLYVQASKSDSPDRRPWWSLAYFFMLPNLVFPLFPVVDYQTFRRTYFDRDVAAIYEQGLLWIARGFVHLLLYRFIYHNVITDAESVVTLGDLAQFMLATLLLYLRVSGQFHLIVGVLHLFGFRLPETHKLYLLSRDFVELWRRINIYWTDFMMKTVFYPMYFRVKKRGPKASLIISTVTVFVATWLLHSYQWFWLRGGFPLTLQDLLFWAALGAFVVVGGLRQLNRSAATRTLSGRRGWDARRGVQAGVTFVTFCVLWSLWSTESVATWVWMLTSAANVDVKGLVLIGVSVGTVVALGGVDWSAPGGSRTMPLGIALRPATRALVALLVLAVLALPVIGSAMPPTMAVALRSLRTTGLNARDLSAQHRGYYEQLDIRAQLDTPVTADGRKRDASWQTLDQLGVLNDRSDLMLRDLKPSRSTTWNGRSFSTNRWGMRDQDYEQAKAPGTLRVALLGPSHVMGNNVADGDVFERLVEQRLNAGDRLPDGRVEILNFAVDGFALPQQVAMLEDRVFRFSPDVVIVTHTIDNRSMTEAFLLKVVSQHIELSNPELHELCARAGLLDVGRSGLPVPHPFARRLLGVAGIPTRMPYGELRSRARRVVDEVLAESFAQFATTVRAHGATPVVLALNVVLDETPEAIPLKAAIDAAGLPVIDLFDVYGQARVEDLRVAPWDDHPNGTGHRLIADRLYPEMVRLLTPLETGEKLSASAGR